MRTQIVAGNWKMNKTFQEADDLVNELVEFIETNKAAHRAMIICPPALYLELATDMARDTELYVGAQNLSQFEKGAYTGEISAPMLASMEVEYSIIGHSERRKYFGENDEMLAAKVRMALKHKIDPIFCCGELLVERESGKHLDVVKSQLDNTVFKLDPVEFGNIMIAYEPVWAIGTGKNATPAQAQEMHAYIRKLISEKFNDQIADNTTILYGGSCNAANAKELFSNPDVDGGLIGGASLIAEDFIKIFQALK
ncbi:MAG: triose-phosphate isomerase [Bacteroidales bacterium]|nr:triose-phosphate isomerase [Bacteroidales bacterium]